jgi:CBS domain-containing protein
VQQTVKEVHSRNPVVVDVDQPQAEAATRMKEADVGILPVVDGDELVGVITDRDLVIRGTALGFDPASASVAEVMTRHVVFCRPSASVAQASRLMATERVRRLLVVDSARELVGMLSLGDIARCADEEAMNIGAAAMRVIAQPMKPQRCRRPRIRPAAERADRRAGRCTLCAPAATSTRVGQRFPK